VVAWWIFYRWRNQQPRTFFLISSTPSRSDRCHQLRRFSHAHVSAKGAVYRLPANKISEAALQMKTVSLPGGPAERGVPALGQGTWSMGENKNAHVDEVGALRLGIDLGMTLIDTAEMYGEGGAEKVVADAIEGQRDRVFVVTKVYPHNASRTELPKACERSLKRLRIDAIDLYLLHWRGNTPLTETVEAFDRLRSAGKIRRWGVSNFDLEDMEELLAIENGSACVANQVLYNLANRQIEFDLLPFHQQSTLNHRPAVMAYSPVGHGKGLLKNETLKKIAKRHDATPAQIALAWVLRQPGVIAIPKASNKTHVRENARSLEIQLTKNDLVDVDRAFPPPRSKQPLAML
jgi:diketogulonate reductase-like aldo/keto reductase